MKMFIGFNSILFRQMSKEKEILPKKRSSKKQNSNKKSLKLSDLKPIMESEEEDSFMLK
jgi:hypothetical protein